MSPAGGEPVELGASGAYSSGEQIKNMRSLSQPAEQLPLYK